MAQRVEQIMKTIHELKVEFNKENAHREKAGN